MVTIHNIDKMKNTLFVFGKHTNGLDRLIKCVEVEEVSDELIPPYKSSYTFDFDIGLGDVPLVIWLDRIKDEKNPNGYRLENNLVDGFVYLQKTDLITFKKFTYALEDYLNSIEASVTKNFFYNA